MSAARAVWHEKSCAFAVCVLSFTSGGAISGKQMIISQTADDHITEPEHAAQVWCLTQSACRKDMPHDPVGSQSQANQSHRHTCTPPGTRPSTCVCCRAAGGQVGAQGGAQRRLPHTDVNVCVQTWRLHVVQRRGTSNMSSGGSTARDVQAQQQAGPQPQLSPPQGEQQSQALHRLPHLLPLRGNARRSQRGGRAGHGLHQLPQLVSPTTRPHGRADVVSARGCRQNAGRRRQRPGGRCIKTVWQVHNDEGVMRLPRLWRVFVRLLSFLFAFLWRSVSHQLAMA